MRKGGLIACSICELIALAVWTGGLIVIIGAVIPSVFNTMAMDQGGRLLARVFDGYNRLTAGAILILTLAAAWRLWLGREEARLTRPEIVLLTLMVAVAAAITLWLTPATVSLQEQAFAAQTEAAKKAAYAEFFKVHTVVRGLYLLNLALGIALLAVKVRAWMNPGRITA